MAILTWILKNYKLLGSFLGIGLTAGSLYLTFNSITDSYYQKGVSDTTRQFEQKLTEQQLQFKKDTEDKLKKLRLTLDSQYKDQIKRIQDNNKVDDNVKTVTKYIEKEVKIPTQCDTVPPNLNSMFNNAIKNINRPSTEH